jgi:hypothetical protein
MYHIGTGVYSEKIFSQSIQTVDTTEAVPIAAARMKTGDKGWANGAEITGSGTKTLTHAANTFVEGYYAGNAGGLSAVETNLVAGNIKAGVTIFGVLGTLGS